MPTLFRLALLLLLVATFAMPSARAQDALPQHPRATVEPTPGPCVDGTLPGGALSRVCVPAAGWNGSLIVYAHGYVAPDEPLDFANLALPGGASITDLTQRRGYAFATTSYRENGLAVLNGVQDMRELIAAFPAVAQRAPLHTYVFGVSEGGLVSTLLIERYPDEVSGGLAACGPIGDFTQQIDYQTDGRVLFDYFFPGVIPGSPIDIPAEVQANWKSVYVGKIRDALNANPTAAAQLVSAARIPLGEPLGLTRTYGIIGVLWYNVFATNDAAVKLGGNPYSNVSRVYSGSADDAALNAGVARFEADPAARAAVAAYQTSGMLQRPLVATHTEADQIVLYEQSAAYAARQQTAAGGRFALLPVARYGHCNFQASELLSAFDQLARQRVYLPLVTP